MDALLMLVVGLSFYSIVVKAQLPELNQCPPEDPNCHPWCIEYVNKCRVCRCKKGFDKQGTGDKTDFGSGFNTDYGGGEFASNGVSSFSSLGDKWVSSGGDGSGAKGNGDKNKIIIIEKETKPEAGMMSFPGSSFIGKSPFQMNGPSRGMMMFPPRRNSIPSGCKTKNVPLVSPGVPRYCVTGLIIDCPHDCVVTDEFGCKSCPCAPATKAWMPICENAPAAKPQNSCIGTKLCIMSCKGEAKIGETGADGCQKCTCIKRENNLVSKTVTTTPKPTAKNIAECTKLIACMIKCKDTGYDIGNTQSDGCPSCRCKDKTSNNNNNSNSNNNNNNNNSNNNNNGKGGMQTWTSGSSGMTGMNTGSDGSGMTGMNTGSGGSGMTGMNTGSGNNILNNVVGGTGSGGGAKCQFPLCIDGGSGGGNPMMPSAGSSGGSSGGCAGPFCASMTGGGSGGGMGMGGGSGGMMMGGGGGGSSGSGPFKASLSSAAAASGGMGSAMKSPFMAAAGGSGGGGADHNPMHGPMLSMGAGVGKATNKDVEKAAYNSECFGPSCSAKNGKMHGLIGSCMDMEKCIANCGGSYEIGPLGPDGCQSCTCNPE